MDERFHARALIERLSAIELEALQSLAAGESVKVLATRRQMSTEEATDVRESMRWKLGVTRDVDAVRIALTAGLTSSAKDRRHWDRS